MNHICKAALFVCLGLSIAMTSCNGANDASTLNPKEFKTAIAANKDALLLDVRTAEEYSGGKIDNAINIDWNKGEANFEEAIKNVPKDKQILIYCQGGSRSASATVKLQALGYTNVQELDGGMVAWNSDFAKAPTENTAATGMTIAEFNEKIKTDKVVLVDFNAEWCTPCQKMKPFLYEMQKTRKDDLVVIFIDTDKNPDIANLFKIKGLPTLMIYKDGVKQWQHEGFMYKEELEQEIATYNK